MKRSPHGFWFFFTIKNLRAIFALLFILIFASAVKATFLTGAIIDESDSNGNSLYANFCNTHSNDFVYNVFLTLNTGAAGPFINGPDDTNAGPISVNVSSPGTYSFVMHAPMPSAAYFDLNLFFNGDNSTPKISVKCPSNSIGAFSANSASNTYVLSPGGFGGPLVPGAGALSFIDGTNQITLTDFRWFNPDYGDVDLPITNRVSAFSASPDGGDDGRGRFTLVVTPLVDCVTLSTGLVTWLPGNGSALDVIGGNNGTLQNGAMFATGKVAQAFSLDGVDDYVQIPHNNNLNPTGAFSVDVWIKANPSQTDSQSLIVDKSHGFTDGTGWDVAFWFRHWRRSERIKLSRSEHAGERSG